MSAPYAYTAHGQPLSPDALGPWAFGAQYGYYTDDATGLQLLTNRYYDPSSGRFLTRDPIGYKGGINLYAYTRNNPVNAIDPLGEDVIAIYNRTTGNLWIYDWDTKQQLNVDNVFSGLPGIPEDQENGPIPQGPYLIGDGANHGHHANLGTWYWFKLYPWPNQKDPQDYLIINGVRRSGFYLHPGTVSDGCVTVKSDVGKRGLEGLYYPSSAAYDTIRKLLDDTKPRVVNGQTYRGVLYVTQ